MTSPSRKKSSRMPSSKNTSMRVHINMERKNPMTSTTMPFSVNCYLLIVNCQLSIVNCQQSTVLWGCSKLLFGRQRGFICWTAVSQEDCSQICTNNHLVIFRGLFVSA
eukprot:XP_001709628.1 Hypothetical protein GL50803_32459 [Giardia lamblia ATCC 50803]